MKLKKAVCILRMHPVKKGEMTYLRLYHERSNPATAKRLKAMRPAKELIETRAGRVFIEMERAIGGQSSKANMVRKAQEAAEKALGGS